MPNTYKNNRGDHLKKNQIKHAIIPSNEVINETQNESVNDRNPKQTSVNKKSKNYYHHAKKCDNDKKSKNDQPQQQQPTTITATKQQ